MLNIKLSLMSFTLLALAGCQSMPKVAQETPNQAFSAETESGEAQERLNQINFKQLKKNKTAQSLLWYWGVVVHVVMHILAQFKF